MQQSQQNGYDEQLDALSQFLKNSIKQLEDRMKMFATKDELQELCSSSAVESMIEDRISTRPSVPKKSAEQLPKRKESRSKMLHEAISRIMQLEEGTIFLNEELQKLGGMLQAKADKTDEVVIAEINNEIKRINEEILRQQSFGKNVDSMKVKMEKITEESENLRYITDQTVKDQNDSMKNLHKMKNELEQLTDVVNTKMGESHKKSF